MEHYLQKTEREQSSDGYLRIRTSVEDSYIPESYFGCEFFNCIDYLELNLSEDPAILAEVWLTLSALLMALSDASVQPTSLRLEDE